MTSMHIQTPACAPAVPDDRYTTVQTGTQTSLNSTIVVAHELYRNRGKIELIEENGCMTIREMAIKTRTPCGPEAGGNLGCQNVSACWFPR